MRDADRSADGVGKQMRRVRDRAETTLRQLASATSLFESSPNRFERGHIRASAGVWSVIASPMVTK